MPADEKLLTLSEVARLLACSERKTWLLTRDGVLPGIQVGRAWRYRLADIDAYLETQKVASTTRGK